MRCAMAARHGHRNVARTAGGAHPAPPGGRVAVTTFASHVGRLRAVAEGPRGRGSRVVLMAEPWSAWAQVARETGYLDVCRLSAALQAYGYLPPRQGSGLCTRSQGEPRAPAGALAAPQTSTPEVTLAKGDRVIFPSRAIAWQRAKAVGRTSTPGGHRASRSSPNRTHLGCGRAIRAVPKLARHDQLGAAEILIPAHGEEIASRRYTQAWLAAQACPTC